MRFGSAPLSEWDWYLTSQNHIVPGYAELLGTHSERSDAELKDLRRPGHWMALVRNLRVRTIQRREGLASSIGGNNQLKTQECVAYRGIEVMRIGGLAQTSYIF